MGPVENFDFRPKNLERVFYRQQVYFYFLKQYVGLVNI